MRNLAIIIAVAFLLYMLVTWFSKTPPKQLVAGLRKYALYGVGALLIFFVITGRMHWLYGALVGLLPLGQRLFTAWRAVNYFRRFTSKGKGQNTNSNTNTAPSGQTSSIKTPYLSMSLDHDTGDMTGLVLKGQFENSHLKDLNLSQLIDLLTECRTSRDNDSVAVLESYLDRYHHNENTNDWRKQYNHDSSDAKQTTPDNSAMTEKEANLILGLLGNADKKEIKAAHRRLMQRFHPDRGGSTYLSAKINQAKDFLLNNIK